MNLNEALLRGLVAVVVVVAAVFALAAVEILLLHPERGVLSMLSRARSQLLSRWNFGADRTAAVAGLSAALLGPAVAAALLATSTTLTLLASCALLLTLPAPLLLALGTGDDGRARLALHDGLAQLTRRSLAMVAIVIAAGAAQHSLLAIPVFAAALVVLIRGRQHGGPSAQPRFDDRLTGPALVCFGVAERAVVVVVGALAGCAVMARSGLGFTGPVAALLVIVASVVVVRNLGPLRGEGVGGPLALLSISCLGRVVLYSLG